MSDRSNSPTDARWWHTFIAGEVLHTAALLKATAQRLELLGDSLPLPEQETVQEVLEAADEELFATHPALSLHVDLGTHAHELDALAGSLEVSALTNLPPENGNA